MIDQNWLDKCLATESSSSSISVDETLINYKTWGNPSNPIIFLVHGYTYSGHPVAAAAGLAAIEVYENEGLFERTLEIEPIFQEKIHSLKGENQIIDIRNIGLMGAVHFGSNGKTATEMSSSVYNNA